MSKGKPTPKAPQNLPPRPEVLAPTRFAALCTEFSVGLKEHNGEHFASAHFGIPGGVAEIVWPLPMSPKIASVLQESYDKSVEALGAEAGAEKTPEGVVDLSSLRKKNGKR